MFVLPQNSCVHTDPPGCRDLGLGGNEAAGMEPREGTDVPITEAPRSPSPFHTAWTQRGGRRCPRRGSLQTAAVSVPTRISCSELREGRVLFLSRSVASVTTVQPHSDSVREAFSGREAWRTRLCPTKVTPEGGCARRGGPSRGGQGDQQSPTLTAVLDTYFLSSPQCFHSVPTV